MSRTARVFSLALLTALVIYYHSAILNYTGLIYWTAQAETPTVVQLPIPLHPVTAPGGSKDASASTDLNDGHATLPASSPQDNSQFNDVKFSFQDDLDYPMPKLNIAKLTKYKAHNDKGAGQFAFATYLSTRNNSVHDPYFLSAQQLVYRLLWDPKSRSTRHPVVVFVAPFIPQEQRDLLRAEGAIVRELELVPWDPPPHEDGSIFPFARWKDLFSKLNIWNQTDFGRVLFLDLDAFPVQNLDGIFDESVSPRQHCNPALLPPEDKPHEAEICDYVWAGYENWGEINVGVVVLEPNKYMHARLLRESQDTTKFDNKMAEQAFLNYAFGGAGPFPPSHFGHEWNGYYPKETDKGLLKIVHEKLWAPGEEIKWIQNIFSDGWKEILALYESPQFEKMRSQDGLLETM